MNDTTATFVTNTPRAGESPEQTAARFASRGSGRTPNAVSEAAKQRASSFVQNISNEAKLSLGLRSDEIRNLHARITTSENALVHYITQFVELTAEVLETSARIKSEIEQVGLPFATMPPATITQTDKETP